MHLHRILMVEPRAPSPHVYSFVHLPRLGLPILGTIAARKGFEVRLLLEEQVPVDDRKLSEADLVCISTITSTAPRAYRLADRARELGVPVVMGGPHVTFLSDEALAHADYVIRGEGERAYPRLLEALAQDGDLGTVPGLSFRRGQEILHNPIDPAPISLADEVVIPDLGLFEGARGWLHRGVIPLQTSRGCPHFCSFCSVTPMFGRKMRHRPIELVAEELERRRGQGNQVFIYDDNFCAPPARTKRLLDYLLSRGVFFPAPLAQVSVKAAFDPELLGLMRRARFFRVFIGFESIDEATLTAYKKGQVLAEIREAIRRFHAHGIGVHGMFVLGSDKDSVETIRRTARFAIEEGLKSIQFLTLTPLPGTPLFEEMHTAGRLLTDDWALYDTHHAVFRPARMSPYTLMTEAMRAMGQVYALRRILWRMLRGEFHDGVLALYANAQVRRWFRANRALLSQPRWWEPTSEFCSLPNPEQV